MVKYECLCPKTRYKARMFALITFIEHNAIRPGGKKVIQFGKEKLKLLLFADDVIAYFENPKKSTDKAPKTGT